MLVCVVGVSVLCLCLCLCVFTSFCLLCLVNLHATWTHARVGCRGERSLAVLSTESKLFFGVNFHRGDRFVLHQDTFASTVAVSDDSSSSSVPPPWRYKLPAKEAASSGRMASTPQRTPAKLSAQSAEGVESDALGPVQTKGRVTGVIRSASGSALEVSSVARRGDGAGAGTRLRLQMGAASRSSSSCDMTRNGREPAGQGVGGCAD